MEVHVDDDASSTKHSASEATESADALNKISPNEQPSGAVDVFVGTGPRELIAAEENTWAEILQLKHQGNALSLSNRIALKDAYIRLARHYYTLGGTEAATNYLKNAIGTLDDGENRHELARLQGEAGNLDFINGYTDLLNGREFDLKLTLEFCFFLERRNLHSAALDIFVRELGKRPQTLRPRDDEYQTLSGFFLLLQANASVESRHTLEDYQRVTKANFPDQTLERLATDQAPLEATMVGHELEEFEENHGLKDEILQYAKRAAFFLRYYLVASNIVLMAVALLLMSILRVPSHVVELTGTTYASLVIAWIVFQAIRSFALDRDARLLAHTKAAQAAVIASLAMLILEHFGSWVGAGVSFFTPLAIKVMSFILVVAVLWRTYLSLATIREILKRTRIKLVQALVRRAYRRQIGSLVSGSARLALVFGWPYFMVFLTQAGLELAIFGLLQTLFLFASWRWGYLEANAKKKSLRDSLVFIIGILFIGLIALDWVIATTMWTVVATLSFDGAIILGVATNFALLIDKLSSTFSYIFSAIFTILNFAPLFKTVEFEYERLFPGLGGTKLTLWIGLVQVVLLFVLIVIVRLARPRIAGGGMKTEINMGSTYQIYGGQQGAVGDNAAATNFTQIWQAHSTDLDLSALADELAALRLKLEEFASEPVHSVALSNLALAEEAARTGDGGTALAQMKKAGAWVWDVATKVGIGLMTAAAKQAIGI